MNVVQQLRKVCNHPELFEQRPVEQPFLCQQTSITLPKFLLLTRSVPTLDLFHKEWYFPTARTLAKHMDCLEQIQRLEP